MHLAVERLKHHIERLNQQRESAMKTMALNISVNSDLLAEVTVYENHIQSYEQAIKKLEQK